LTNSKWANPTTLVGLIYFKWAVTPAQFAPRKWRQSSLTAIISSREPI